MQYALDEIIAEESGAAGNEQFAALHLREHLFEVRADVVQVLPGDVTLVVDVLA